MDTDIRKVRFNAKYVAVLAEFMAKKDVRYYLNGMFVTPHPDGGVILTATDGHTAVLIHDAEGETNGDYIFAPSKALIAASKKRVGMVGRPEAVELIGESAYVRLFKNDLAYDPTISAQDAHVEHCPTIDGKFPDMRRVIPTGTPEPSLITLNPEYMARIAKVGKALRLKFFGASFFTYGADKCTAVRLASLPEALFVIMSMRGDDAVKNLVGSWLESWVKSGKSEEKKQAV
jgi:DNA polymerase-3 subunit beta